MGKNVSATGERAAIGGYKPQFDEFARLVYQNIVNNELEWIKVADPEAEKLDDILYSTKNEVHAYQVKWTISGAKISYSNFIELLPKLTGSWKKLRDIYKVENKLVVPHLLTNKQLSTDDLIKVKDNKIGTFKNFIDEVWESIRKDKEVDDKWTPIIDELKKLLGFDESELYNFIKLFEFSYGYIEPPLSVSNRFLEKHQNDILNLSRFIFETVAGESRIIKLTRYEITKNLGWIERLNPTFNHELVVDSRKYQPIEPTLNKIDRVISQNEKGYVYLIGGPGSGKSTLLNQWSIESTHQTVKYFAFDFSNPSKQFNDDERGEILNLYFDLVVQLKNRGYSVDKTLTHKEISHLKRIFYEQLVLLSNEYISSGKKTVIIIDGLDHIPREYKVNTSLIRGLPSPDDIPEGVYIILGSQTLKLEDISQEIAKDFEQGNQTIEIEGLPKNSVFKYLEVNPNLPQLSEKQKLDIFEKSAGHPLYLNYISETLAHSENIGEILNSFEPYGGNIDIYYNKLWNPIKNNQGLVELFGLISRIEDSINLNFIGEWGFEDGVLRDFSQNAKFLLSKSENNYTFFHNSFRQFLLNQSSISHLTDTYDERKNRGFHHKLAKFYKNSKIERSWKKNPHLFYSGEYDEFLKETTPEALNEQFLEFRSLSEITQEAKMGIEIAKIRHDIRILTRYLSILAEFEQRSYHIDPPSLSKHLIELGDISLAKSLIRTNKTLLVTNEFAIEIAIQLYDKREMAEAALLFELASPSEIKSEGIVIDDSRQQHEAVNELRVWISGAVLWRETSYILKLIQNLTLIENQPPVSHYNDSQIRRVILGEFGFGLIKYHKWDGFTQVLEQLNPNDTEDAQLLFQLYIDAIYRCLENGEQNRSKRYINEVLNSLNTEELSDNNKINLANVIYKCNSDIGKSYEILDSIPYPLKINLRDMGAWSFNSFHYYLVYHKLLNLSGKPIPNSLVGADTPKERVEVNLNAFLKVLHLSVNILTDGLEKKPVYGEIGSRVSPIIKFYYHKPDINDHSWYKFEGMREGFFDFLIFALSELFDQKLDLVIEYFFKQFETNSNYWNISNRRNLIKSFINHGYPKEKLVEYLNTINKETLGVLDIHGKVTACTDWVELYTIIGDKQNAKRFLNEALKQSIGIGYRKDYQFATWIDWLDRMNDKKPSEAFENIQWFISHLQFIKESTEGDAYWDASRKLLSSAFKFNFSYGFEQMKWQLDNGLVDFSDAIFNFIKSYAIHAKSEDEFEPIISAYCNLHLPIIAFADYRLLEIVLDNGLRVLGQKFETNLLDRVIHSIKTFALEEMRNGLLLTILEFCESNKIDSKKWSLKDEAKIETKEKKESSNTLKLKKNDEYLTESDVIERVKNFESLWDILKGEDLMNSHFNWSKTLNGLTFILTEAQLEKLLKIDRSNSRSVAFYASLSKISKKLGYDSFALSFAEKGLNASNSYGWNRYYDGGTRLTALESLIAIDNEKYTKLAFETFCDDILESGSVYSSFQEIENIAPIIVGNYNEVEVWEEIQGYLKRLLSNSKVLTVLPNFVNAEKSCLEVFSEFLIYLSKYKVRCVSEPAQILLAERVFKNCSFAISSILKLNVADSNDSDIFLNIMCFLVEQKVTVSDVFSIILRELSVAKNYWSRVRATRVLTFMGQKPITPKKQALSPIYTLSLPPENEIIESKSATNKSDNPKSWFDGELKVLSNLSSLELENIKYRFQQLVSEFAINGELDENHESEIRNHLTSISIEFSFKKPSFNIEINAIMHMLSELLDSEWIVREPLENLFTQYDYAVPLFPVQSKPSFVEPLKKNEYDYFRKKWVDSCNESEKFTREKSQYRGLYIIGEYSYQKNLDWGTPKETFFLELADEELAIKEQNPIFGSYFQELSNNYHTTHKGLRNIIIIRDNTFTQFSLKSTWIAINPSLATYLEWVPDHSKLFAWKDKNGKLMAESIYWQNGNSEMTPRKDSEVGEGWIVLVSSSALKQINEVIPNLKIIKKVERSLKESGEYYSNSHIKTEN